MTIRITCKCGKQVQTRDEKAGKRVKCPACAAVLTVPQAESPPTEDFDAAPEPEVRTTSKPKPAVKPPVLDDEDDASEEEELPARRGKKPVALDEEDEDEREE